MLYRGQYPIPWGCQFRPYDPYEKDILACAGKTVYGHRAREEDKPAFGYDYFLFSPKQPTTSWTAFCTRSELQQFLDAYGLIMESEPARGQEFVVRIPDAPVLAPLRHVATELVKDETGLSFRVAKLGDEPFSPLLDQKPQDARRLMQLELWDGEAKVAEYGPFTVGGAPSILPDPDVLAPEEIERGLAVLLGSLPWDMRWMGFESTTLAHRIAGLAQQVRDEAAKDAPAATPRMKG